MEENVNFFLFGSGLEKCKFILRIQTSIKTPVAPASPAPNVEVYLCVN